MSRLRNIGISAHIDAGKSTLAEQMLFVSGQIRSAGQVRQGQGVTMDSHAVEKQKGITVKTAAVSLPWGDGRINLIDTPGHVDFGIEVERALSVLDGVVLVLSAVHGVQTQTRTIDAQLRRHDLPVVAFVNKCDLAGADPVAVVDQLSDQLGRRAVLTQHWQDGRVVDVLAQDGPARERLLDQASLFSDALTEALLEGRAVSEALVHQAIAEGVRRRELVPVCVGSAHRGLGVRELMDRLVAWLPGCEHRVWATSEGLLRTSSDGDPVALVFKTEESRFGVLAWVRVVSGVLSPGVRLGDVRVGRLLRLDPRGAQPIESATAGDICALYGVQAPSGELLGSTVTLPALRVPPTVVEVSAQLVQGKAQQLGKALARYQREDPSFEFATDPESGELRLRGVGELQLEVYAERLWSEHRLRVQLGAPQVARRRTVSRAVDFDHLVRKQDGGSGLYARIRGRLEPIDGEDVQVDWQVVGGEIPSAFRKAVVQGFEAAAATGQQDGVPVIGVRVVVLGGRVHVKDTSDQAFQICAFQALRQAVLRAEPVELEPVALVATQAPEDRHGAVLRCLGQRGAQVLEAIAADGRSAVEARMPLASVFGLSGDLRSATAGAGTYSLTVQGFQPR